MKAEYDILTKYVSGNCSAEEKEQIASRLEHDTQFKNEYEVFTQIWGLSDKLSYDDSVAESSWNEFKAIVKAPIKVFGFDWLKVAASILLLAAFSVTLYITSGNDDYRSADGVVAIDLNDQTAILLNDQSLLSILSKDERTVALEGEAFFDVSTGTPFTVEFNGGEIEVHGTEFNVFSTSEDYLNVELYEGSISLTVNGLTKKMSAGTGVEYIDGDYRVYTLRQTAPSWKNEEEILCHDVSLKRIMLELQKQYGVDFELNSKQLKERYTMSLPKDDLRQCLDIINKISDINLKLNGNRISTP